MMNELGKKINVDQKMRLPILFLFQINSLIFQYQKKIIINMDFKISIISLQMKNRIGYLIDD